MRMMLRLGSGALVLLALLFGGSLVLWVGLPLAWLWIASQVQSAAGSLGLAVVAGLVGFVASVIVYVPLLTWLSNKHREQRLARGEDDTGHLALEVVMVTSAGIALVGFVAWFLLLSGSAPIPLGLNP